MATVKEKNESDAPEMQAKPPFLRRVRIRGYKSIAFCDVTLEPLTILVGRNASGKSNFVDALAFLRDIMGFGVSTAVKLRDNWEAIHCQGATDKEIFIEVEVSFWSPPLHERPEIKDLIAQREVTPTPEELNEKGTWLSATYGLTLTPRGYLPPLIKEEGCSIKWDSQSEFYFNISDGKLKHGWRGFTSINEDLSIPEQRLYTDLEHPFLTKMDDFRFRDIVSHLSSMFTYNFYPNAIRRPRKQNLGWELERDGNNLASVVETTRAMEVESIERVGRYLSVITESVELLGVAKYGEYETVRFRVPRNGKSQPLEFDAASMSDGTLRVLAALVAAFQNVSSIGIPSLVAIEEPETSLHPAAMRALVDALDEATLRTQILLTTHSADMLDNPTIKPENVRVVQMIDGQTMIGSVDEGSLEIVRRNLDTLGGLERQNQLEINLDDLERQRQLSQTEPETS